jgi:hypothetical protein
MKNYYLVLIFLFMTLFMSYSQTTEVVVVYIPKLNLKLDSIEKRIELRNGGKNTYYFFHYSITNTSKDTITYSTNSCPSYNQFQLNTSNNFYFLNYGVCCSFNIITQHLILPNETISFTEYGSIYSLLQLKQDELVFFKIPLEFEGVNKYRINGYNENDKLGLTYIGTTKFIIHTVNEKQ